MRRRRRRGGRPVALLLILAAVAAFILYQEVYVVRNVQIVGEVSVPDESIVRMAQINFGSSIFAVDKAEIRDRLNAAGSIAVDAVEVVRPNTIRLSVHERKPCAMLLHMGKIRVLDEDGFVLASADEAPDMDLVYVNGMRVMAQNVGAPLTAGDGQMEAYCAVMQALDHQSARQFVSELDLEDLNRLKLVTRAGIRVELGDRENMENKILWMKSAVQDIEQRSEGGGILDVSSGSKADYRR